MAVSNFYVFLLLLGIVTITKCERLHEQIYSSIEGGAPCFRRLNGTHQAGCSSSDKGAVGVIHMVDNISDAQWLVYNATEGPYMAVVSTSLFYDIVELFMSYPKNIAGVLIYDNVNDSATSFTQDSRCPNEYSSGPGSLCSSSQAGGVVWNEKGTGLLKRDIPFPIFFLPQSRSEEIVKIRDCYERFNYDKNNQQGRPLCSAQLNSFMFAAVSSEVCMRRSATSTLLSPTKVCDPLGDNNVYYSLFPGIKTKDSAKKSVTLVTARIDSASLFDGVSPGSASSVVGMVTLITAAATLSQLIPVTDSQLYEQNVLWTLFNGEAFDYIGSQRVAYDLQRAAWPAHAPLTPADIPLHVEIGQIGGSVISHLNDTTWPLHAFTATQIVSETLKFLNSLSTYGEMYNMTVFSEYTTNLPPSSLHSFRRILRNVTESGDLGELLITDHNNTFTNMYYNSALDDYDKIGFNYHNISISSDGQFVPTPELIANGTMKENELQVKISRLSTVVARTLYQRVTGKDYAGDVVASAHLVDEMLYCFLRSQACRLLLAAEYAQGAGAEESLPDRAAPLYVGVATWPATAPVFAGHLLALLTGTHLPLNKSGCDAQKEEGFSNYWLRGWNHTGVCIQTTMNFSQALSPAFIIPDYDLKSGIYSTWTESVWHAMWARVFVSAGGGGAAAAGAAGLLATAAAALLTYWLQRHASLVFLDRAPASMAVDDAASGILRTVNC
ncbi:nicastrin isoform X1 [Manduca sexta]|uniref:nicastrin isoform X1 n=1 Tax=Manduca sexta TaxID=7130 RepID=UPI00188F8317|nr:nicastrin isoform X1 [Manduca sexta]